MQLLREEVGWGTDVTKPRTVNVLHSFNHLTALSDQDRIFLPTTAAQYQADH